MHVELTLRELIRLLRDKEILGAEEFTALLIMLGDVCKHKFIPHMTGWEICENCNYEQRVK